MHVARNGGREEGGARYLKRGVLGWRKKRRKEEEGERDGGREGRRERGSAQRTPIILNFFVIFPIQTFHLYKNWYSGLEKVPEEERL